MVDVEALLGVEVDFILPDVTSEGLRSFDAGGFGGVGSRGCGVGDDGALGRHDNWCMFESRGFCMRFCSISQNTDRDLDDGPMVRRMLR
jgi:hypothetical protein